MRIIGQPGITENGISKTDLVYGVNDMQQTGTGATSTPYAHTWASLLKTARQFFESMGDVVAFSDNAFTHNPDIETKHTNISSNFATAFEILSGVSLLYDWCSSDMNQNSWQQNARYTILLAHTFLNCLYSVASIVKTTKAAEAIMNNLNYFNSLNNEMSLATLNLTNLSVPMIGILFSMISANITLQKNEEEDDARKQVNISLISSTLSLFIAVGLAAACPPAVLIPITIAIGAAIYFIGTNQDVKDYVDVILTNENRFFKGFLRIDAGKSNWSQWRNNQLKMFLIATVAVFPVLIFGLKKLAHYSATAAAATVGPYAAATADNVRSAVSTAAATADNVSSAVSTAAATAAAATVSTATAAVSAATAAVSAAAATAARYYRGPFNNDSDGPTHTLTPTTD